MKISYYIRENRRDVYAIVETPSTYGDRCFVTATDAIVDAVAGDEVYSINDNLIDTCVCDVYDDDDEEMQFLTAVDASAVDADLLIAIGVEIHRFVIETNY